MKLVKWLEKHVLALLVVLLLLATFILIWSSVSGYTQNVQQATLGVAIAGVLLAAISSVASFMQAVEARKQREQQERPYVLAYFQGDSSGVIYFIIENAGNSPALNVRVAFDPAPIDYAGRPMSEVSLFKEAIGFLPPGKRHQQIVDVGHKLLADGRPTAYVVNVHYDTIYKDKEADEWKHDLAYLRQATLPRKSTADYLKEVSSELNALNNQFRRVQRSGAERSLVETSDG